MNTNAGPSQVFWGGPDYGWYGSVLGALNKADAFGKFTESEREVLARIVAEHIGAVTSQPCDATYMPGPGLGRVSCGRSLGHPGPHRKIADDQGSAEKGSRDA